MPASVRVLAGFVLVSVICCSAIVSIIFSSVIVPLDNSANYEQLDNSASTATVLVSDISIIFSSVCLTETSTEFQSIAIMLLYKYGHTVR